MSREAKHTPGPWTSDNEFFTVITGANGVNVAITLNPVIASKNQKPTPIDFEEIKANGRLLAAAPEMFDALPDLSAVITWLENGCDPLKACDELRIYKARIDAAKAKAKGRHP